MHHVAFALTWIVTSISNLWSESIYDKEFVRRSCSLNEALWEKNDTIMADWGFLISDYPTWFPERGQLVFGSEQ